MSTRPVKTGQDEFATARLPPGDGEATDDVVAVKPERDPHEVLGVAPDAPDAVVEGAFRELVKEAHADQGDNDAYSVDELTSARDALVSD